MRQASREAKVNELNTLLCFIEKNVLKFDISVSYIALVTIVDGLHNLFPKELSLELGHLTIGLHLEVPMQTSSIHELHNEEHLFVRLEDFVQFGDVLVVQFFHDFHFAFDTFTTVGFHQFCFFVDLDGNLLV